MSDDKLLEELRREIKYAALSEISYGDQLNWDRMARAALSVFREHTAPIGDERGEAESDGPLNVERENAAAEYTRYNIGGMQPVVTIGERVHDAFVSGAEWAAGFRRGAPAEPADPAEAYFETLRKLDPSDEMARIIEQAKRDLAKRAEPAAPIHVTDEFVDALTLALIDEGHNGIDCRPDRALDAAVRDALMIALSEAPAEPTVTNEWEYGSKGYCFDWDDRRCRDTFGSLAQVLAHEEEAHGGNPSRPVRRRKAGPWAALTEGEKP